MWLDNASEIDLLFYKPYSDLILSTVQDNDLNPLTIGLFGSWGAGKSTLLNMVEKDIGIGNDNIVCVSLNAWMFEGYDDAKSALMESLLEQIQEKKGMFGEISDKLKSLFKRIKYFKLGTDALSKGLPIAASLIAGNPLPLALSFTGDISNILDQTPATIESIKEFKEKYIKEEDKDRESTVQNIRLFKIEFTELLLSSKINNLVVIIDDLDRCTPDRIIDTLEAIKLFLSVPKTTFILAVDERIIEYSVKRKYPLLDEGSIDISRDYIEKIIQLPIYIPELSSKDIENYLLILLLQLYLNVKEFNNTLEHIYSEKYMLDEKSMTEEQLIDLISTNNSIFKRDYTREEFYNDLKTISSVKGIVSANLKGNPRQAKRFLNAFIAKKYLSKMYFGDDINIQILVKLLALQTIDIDAFRELNEWNKEFDGENKQLKTIIETYINGTGDLPAKHSRWSTPRIQKWILCEPKELYKENLSKYFYLSREVLNKNVDLLDGLSTDEKDILQQIVNSSEGRIDIAIEKLRKKDVSSLDNIIKALMKKFEVGDLSLGTIRRIFSSFEGYRSMIINSISKMDKQALTLPSIPHLLNILIVDPELVKPIFDKMKDKNMPNATYDAVFKQFAEIDTK